MEGRWKAEALRLHHPRREELWIRQRWLADPVMMSYNAGWDVSYPGYDRATGCIDWPESEWDEFQSAYLLAPPGRAGYFFVQLVSPSEFVGHVHYRLDEKKIAHIGINVVPSQRRRGLGRQGLCLLCEHVWRVTDAVALRNDFEDTRESARRLHQRLGFVAGDEPAQGVRAWTFMRPEGST